MIKETLLIILFLTGLMMTSCSVQKNSQTGNTEGSLEFEVEMIQRVKKKQIGSFKLVNPEESTFYGVTLAINNPSPGRKSLFLYKVELSAQDIKQVPTLFFQGNGISFADEWLDVRGKKKERRYLVYIFPKNIDPEKLLIEGYGSFPLPEKTK